MERLDFSDVQERIYYEQLDNGLSVFLLPKEGFSKTYAVFTAQYGSIDNHFQAEGEDEVRVPDGIAHFLEHKMFEKADGDVFHQFSRQGASANAFTTFDRTAYLFSATDRVEENLATLLDFVQSPYFTDTTVEKEKGIIAQEIRMYEDNPDFRVYFNLVKGMFHEHPVRLYVAGTVESIQRITADMLYSCYEHFYHPRNMLLFVTGPINPEEIMERVRKNQGEKTFPEYREIRRFYPYEPPEIANPFTEERLPVGISKCLLGFKERTVGLLGEDLLKRELLTRIILECFVGESSLLYQELYEEGLIGGDFGADYSGEFTYGFSVIGGDTPDPGRLAERLKEGACSFREKGIGEEEFERSRRKMLGNHLRSLNSLEFVANQFTRYQFNDSHLFRILPVLESLTLQEARERLEEHVDPEQMVVSIVRPSD